MIKNRLIRRYKVDPYGTEEIVSNDSLSTAPILDIDYGDGVQQGTQFILRPTKGVLDTNIVSPAVINVVKGDTVKFNQLLENGDFSDGDTKWGHTYHTEAIVSEGVLVITATGDNSQATHNVPAIPAGHKVYVSFLTRKENSVNATSVRVALRKGHSGNVVGGYVTTALNTNWTHGSVLFTTNAEATTFIIAAGDTVDRDIWYLSNVNVIDITDIFGTGNEPSTVEAFEAWLTQKIGYKEYYSYDLGSLIPVKMSGIKTTGINPVWESITNIPVTSLKGRLNGTGSSVVVFPDGMKSAGDVRDEIKVENNILKGFKRVGTRAYQSGDVDSSTMTTDDANYTNYTLSTPEEYVIDDIDVNKIMLGNREISKVYLGDQVIFESN